MRSFVDHNMFMRYYGGGIGHRGMGTPTISMFDDEEPDPEWLDVVSDTAELESEVPAVVEHADGLLRLAIPDSEASEAQLEEAIAQELATMQNAATVDRDRHVDDIEDVEPEEWELEDDDGRAHALGEGDEDVQDGNNEDDDMYSSLGYAAL